MISDTGASSNLVPAACLSRAWSGNAIKMETSRLRLTINPQMKEKRVVRLKVKVGQSVAEVDFLVLTILNTAVFFGTAYIDKIIEKINRKNGMLNRTGTSLVVIEKCKYRCMYFQQRGNKKTLERTSTCTCALQSLKKPFHKLEKCISMQKVTPKTYA